MIGLLGYGTVGQGVYELAQRINDERIKIKKIAVNDLNKKREGAKPELFTNSVEEIINDPEIDIIIESTGHVRAYEWFEEAFSLKKSVITANKAAVSKKFEELSKSAYENGVYFLYEAAVAGGIPVIKAVKDITVTNKIDYVGGILNGTSNYLATAIEHGKSFEEALEEAKKSGYAESDPTADISGLDALRKLRILATLAFNETIEEEDIINYSVEHIETDAFDKDKIVKQLALAYRVDGKITAFVMPKLLYKTQTLSSVHGNLNGVVLKGDVVGKLFWAGEGAGRYPTANAVITDLLDIINRNQNLNNPLENVKKAEMRELRGKFLLRTKKPLPRSIQSFCYKKDENYQGALYETDFVEFSKLAEYKGSLALLELEYEL